jgi:hypothetical protein
MNNLITLPSGKTVNLTGFAQAYVDKTLEMYVIEWPNDTDEPFCLAFAEEDARAIREYIEDNAYRAI